MKPKASCNKNAKMQLLLLAVVSRTLMREGERRDLEGNIQDNLFVESQEGKVLR